MAAWLRDDEREASAPREDDGASDAFFFFIVGAVILSTNLADSRSSCLLLVEAKGSHGCHDGSFGIRLRGSPDDELPWHRSSGACGP